MARETERSGTIGKSTPITLSLVFLIFGVSAGAIFKAGQVLTEFDYVKSAVAEIRSDIVDIKRLVREDNARKEPSGR